MSPSALRSPAISSQPPQPRRSIDEVTSDDSDASSVASSVTTISAAHPSNNRGVGGTGGIGVRLPRTSSATPTANSNAHLNPNRGPSAAPMSQSELSVRKPSGRSTPADGQRHRSKHHSQGFFEPSLPTASTSDATIPASRIAAQTAMQHQQLSSHYAPKRSQPVSQSSEDVVRNWRRGSDSSPPPPPALQPATSGALSQPQQPSHQNGNGGFTNVATTAANLAYPRNISTEQVPEREHKPKSEKSKMKLFSKPKHIGISREREPKEKGAPSPSKMAFSGAGGLSRIVSASTASIADPHPLQYQSMYNLPDGSSSTVVPVDPKTGEKEKEKDKVHKHHFLSRQKLKLKDRDDHYNLPLSSASSNSKPSDPSAPQSLYSFTPASPGTATFSKSVSGLDILHGGRALREKKKEEKALAESEQLDAVVSGTPAVFATPSSLGSSTAILGETALKETLQGFGLNNMTPEDAWDFLKAKLLVIFDGEDVRIAIEDLNKLVLVHIQRCVQKRTPTSIITDLRELLGTGFASLNQSLTGIPDEKLVPHLVQIWMLVFGTILPFIQAVFLPLDLEFRGCGPVMNSREADEFWKTTNGDATGSGLDVRNLVLIGFRDLIILNRYETLKATFSRLSLDSINLSTSAVSVSTKNSSVGRPGTAASLDAGTGSYSSQSSTLLNTGGSYSSDSMGYNRSRAASNTSSNPDQLMFQSFSSPSQRPAVNQRPLQTDTSHVITETVGRMLQCVSVLASVQTGDEAQERIETLSKSLKHNWLGRGRTGRDRRGFVGTKIRQPTTVARTNSDESTRGGQGLGRNGESDWAKASVLRQGSSEVSVS